MSRWFCPCGYPMDNHSCPNENGYVVYTEAEWDHISSQTDKENRISWLDIPPSDYEVYQCPECKRILVFRDSERCSSYKPETLPIENVVILKAARSDLQEILNLQYLAYQSEAALFGTQDIPPLKQTLSEVVDEFNSGIILKMVADDIIIGSVRAMEKNGTVYIGKLMVHPNYQCKGLGSKLLAEIESCYPDQRYELFTSTRSRDNIRLYLKMGYTIFDIRTIHDELRFVYMEKT